MTRERYQHSASDASKFGPIAWLRTIRRVIEDSDLSHAQAVVVIALILRADNKTRLAWGGYRGLAKVCRVSTSTVRLAIQGANKYIEAAGSGKQGAKRYRVRAQRPQKRIEGQSAAASKARRSDQRSASAATVAHKLTQLTNSSTSKKLFAPSGANDARSKPSRNASQRTAKSLTTWNPQTHWTLDPRDRAVLEKAYPAVNIDAELPRMTAWLVANPAKAHKSNWFRFLNNWLRKEQDRGGDRTAAPRLGVAPHHAGAGTVAPTKPGQFRAPLRVGD